MVEYCFEDGGMPCSDGAPDCRPKCAPLTVSRSCVCDLRVYERWIPFRTCVFEQDGQYRWQHVHCRPPRRPALALAGLVSLPFLGTASAVPAIASARWSLVVHRPVHDQL